VSGGILVIRGGAIGDFILTLPVLSALRRRFPGVRLEVLGQPGIVSVAVAGGLADNARSLESAGLAGFFSEAGELDREWRRYFAGFDIIISYLFDASNVFTRNLARCGSARFIAGKHRPDEGAGIHATDVFLSALEPLGISGADATPRLSINPVKPRSSGLWLAAHPGSGSERKNWHLEKWEVLLEMLARETPLNLLLVGGEAEGARLERLAARFPQQRLELAYCRPLPELAALMAGCAGYIGHDSGITHLAGALGLRGVALWGPSNLEVWRPRGGNLRIVRDERGLEFLEAGRVFEQLRCCCDLSGGS